MRCPVKQGPFYAVKVLMGDLGTFDGLRTSVVGEVLHSNGTPSSACMPQETIVRVSWAETTPEQALHMART